MYLRAPREAGDVLTTDVLIALVAIMPPDLDFELNHVGDVFIAAVPEFESRISGRL